MFYSETILSRRGPLGKVWLAAHMERKLSKTQTLQTDIEQSVDAIMGQEIEVMALRLSGQLLLGVVRIYSRKAKYLLDDCNEALLKIKMAFRPGLVDMTDEQLVVSKHAITLPSNMVDLDLLLPDVNWDLDHERYPQHSTGNHQAHVDDITLHPMDNLQHLDIDLFDVGAAEGIGSQDFQDIDLGINWDDERYHGSRDDMSSLGIGRDASPRASVNSYIGGLAGKPDSFLSARSPDHASANLQHGDAFDVEFSTFEGVDLGEFGVGFNHQDSQMPRERVLSRASSPLTELPLTPPSNILDVNALNVDDGKLTARKKARGKRQIVDSITELQGDIESSYPRFEDTQDAVGTVGEQQFLRKSPIVLRLLEIHNNPTTHFFNGKGKQQNSLHCAAPSGLEFELIRLFMRPAGRHLLPMKRSLSPSEQPSSKRPRNENIEEMPDVELEYGRKDASPTASLRLGSDVLRRSIDFDIGPTVAEDQTTHFDDQMDVRPDTFELELNMPSTYSHVPKLPQEQERPHVDETLADDACPLADFSSGPLRHSQDAEPSAGSGSFSNNTLKAMEIIRKELLSSGPSGTLKTLNFQALSDKATRRAAASFFFELLLLGTRDYLRLSQHNAFDRIEIMTKEKFWSRVEPSQME